MKNIGIVRLTERVSGDEKSKYIDTLYKEEYDLIELTSTNFEEEIDTIDAILIDSEETFDVGKVCEWIIRIREKTEILVWVIQKNPDSISRIVYLQLGADKNISNEYSPKEFELSFENTLKRMYSRESSERNTTLSHHPNEIQLDDTNRNIWIGDTAVALTIVEYNVMKLLYSKQGTVFSYEEIQQAVWKSEKDAGRYRVANVIFHIRKKLEKSFLNTNYIQTIRSRGYRLMD